MPSTTIRRTSSTFSTPSLATPITEKLGALFAIQFTDQRSTGSDLLQGRFSTNQVGIKGEASYGGAVLVLGYTHANRGADLRNHKGANPSYTAVQVQPFNARVHQYQGPRDTLNEYRAIFNYDFGLL